MNAKMKKRMIAVSGVIVIVLILVLAFVGGNTAATTLSVAEAAENPQAGQKVQVSGNVVQDSLMVSQLIGYGDDVIGKVVKVSGTVKAGTLSAAGQGDRFVIVDTADGSELPVAFDDALSEDVADGTAVVLTGALTEDGKFAATDVALEG